MTAGVKTWEQLIFVPVKQNCLQVVRLFRPRHKLAELAGNDFIYMLTWDEASKKAKEMLETFDISEEGCLASASQMWRLCQDLPDFTFCPTHDEVKEAVESIRVQLAAVDLLERGKAPETAIKLYSLLEDYPTGDSCLLAQEQSIYVLSALGYKEAAAKMKEEMEQALRDIQKWIDRNYA